MNSWRVRSLIVVHVFIALHLTHWLVTGYSLAPLEVSETLHTLHRGVITAGFVLMVAAIAGTAIFGRFFCGWGCHIVALQDLSAAGLAKIGIKPKLLRSRTLQWVPLIAAAYLFLWPIIWRIGAGVSHPTLHVGSDDDGWGGFMTTDVWRSFPDWPISVATLLICGFAVVYLLGSRAFCRYACPYGAVFGVADRFAPGRVQVTGDCNSCGKCTTACGSGVTVHLEVKQFGMVTDSRCLKTFDCIEACPVDALSYGFAAPPLYLGPATGQRYDLTIGEEFGVSGVFLASFLTFRGLYEIPFLMALGVAMVVAYVAVKGWRLRWRTPGWAHAGVVALAMFVAHSAAVHYHELRGQLAFVALPSQQISPSDPGVIQALHHLQWVERYGLAVSPSVRRRLASLFLVTDRAKEAEGQLNSVILSDPHDMEARLNLGLALHRLDRDIDAAVHYAVIVADDHADPTHRAAAQVALAAVDVQTGGLEDAEQRLRQAVRWDVASSQAQSNLGVVLHRRGKFEEALGVMEVAADLSPHDTDVLRNLAGIALSAQRFDVAEAAYRRVVELDPGDKVSASAVQRLEIRRQRK